MPRKKKDPFLIALEKEKQERIKECDTKRIFYDMYVRMHYSKGESPNEIAKSLGKPEVFAIARIKELKLDE